MLGLLFKPTTEQWHYKKWLLKSSLSTYLHTVHYSVQCHRTFLSETFALLSHIPFTQLCARAGARAQKRIGEPADDPHFEFWLMTPTASYTFLNIQSFLVIPHSFTQRWQIVRSPIAAICAKLSQMLKSSLGVLEWGAGSSVEIRMRSRRPSNCFLTKP